jgi:hypothetical protein
MVLACVNECSGHVKLEGLDGKHEINSRISINGDIEREQ